ncbi:MAG TPA: SRPBCC family protein [Ornithinibacter sp.]|nr:SRPBCC family protein [Ornithinibacter sp.]
MDEVVPVGGAGPGDEAHLLRPAGRGRCRLRVEGNRKAGKGAMTITADTPQQVDVDLHFDKPFPADSRFELVLTPAGERSTVVEWRLHGELSGMTRLFSLVKSMDSLVGPDFEKGLARLKRLAEAG